ncbi:hypothetical protein [Priestia megaterium]|uniref:hypothetical protein n=1 Tax=Priestia megaterium TaxID=1404 RepID=UPI00203E8B2B|nr:hypothetical protein [Priestia megaterium]MCM3181908.1 hypothetical protein [Priestia megaterium]
MAKVNWTPSTDSNVLGIKLGVSNVIGKGRLWALFLSYTKGNGGTVGQEMIKLAVLAIGKKSRLS